MKQNYSVTLLIAVLLFHPASAFSQVRVGTKSTFVNQDIFHSSVFMENPDVISDYHGEKIIYSADHSDVRAYFTEKGVIYCIGKLVTKKNAKDEQDKDEEERNDTRVFACLAIMEWDGANPNPVISTGSKEQGYYTMIKKVGNTYKTITASGYKTITYKEVYPGIDVEFTLPEGDKAGIEYNLIVKPGADLSRVKLHYSGDVKQLIQDANGNIIIHTKNGDLMEHAPQTFYKTGQSLASGFTLNGKRLQFNFPGGYDKSQALVIDPWVTTLTTLTTKNIGFNVDYDFAGNLFVFGAGPTSYADLTHYFKLAKYDINGNLLWTFNGSVPSVPWNTADPGDGINCPGNFIVDKSTGNVYLGKGVDDDGTQTIRLDQNGNYDNFITAANEQVTETWGFAYNCSQGSLLEMGGGVTSDINMGVINTATGAITSSNITGITNGSHEDIICGTYDSSGNLYVILDDRDGYLPYKNTIYRVNSAYTGYNWDINSGYTTFNELANAPYWSTAVYSNNWFNSLAANGSYLYYYDGFNLTAYQLATGAVAGNPFAISGYTPMYQGGIAVDNCNNVYLGGVGVIKVFHFDGTNFNPGTDISLGSTFTNDALIDVKYNPTNNLLYVTGKGIVGTYTATPSVNCNPVASYTVSVSSPNCDSAMVHVSPSAGLNPQIFTYLWTDSANNIVSEVTNTSDTINVVSGLSNGTYEVQVQWNSNCGGTSVSQPVTLRCYPWTYSDDTTLCPGEKVTLWASAPVGSFVWSPGGATTDSITIVADSSIFYTVTYTPPVSLLSSSATIHVTVVPLQVVAIEDTSVCLGQTARLTTNVTVPGGLYDWIPGGANSSAISVSPANTTKYQVTYSVAGCTSTADSATVTVLPLPIDSIVSDKTKLCTNDSIQICALPGLTSYHWNSGNVTSCITVSAPGIYYVTATDKNGCSAQSNNINITLAPVPHDSISATNNNFCTNDSATICSNDTFTSYAWSNGGINNCISINQPGAYYVVVTDVNGCTAQSNNLVISTLAAPRDTIYADKSIFCTYDSATICSQDSFLTYQWNTGEQGSCLVTRQAGTYYLVVTDANGCTAESNHIPISLYPVAADSISAPKAGFCTGDSADICAVAGFTSYQWNNGATGTCIVVGQAGSYYVITTDHNGCTALSDTLSVSAFTAPRVTISADKTEFCPNDSASICSTVSTFKSYEWNTGATGTCIYAKETGEYYLSVTDNNDCTAVSNDISIELYPVPSIPIIENGNVLTSWGAVTYQWYLDGQPLLNETSDTCIARESGAYTVAETDSFGCNALSAPVNMTISGIDEVADERVLLYPNPSAGNWQLAVTDELIGSTLLVYDEEGRLILQSEIRNLKSEIQLNVARGVYWLTINSGQEIIVRKLVRL